MAAEIGYFMPFFYLILHAPHHTRALMSMKMAVFTDSHMNFVAPSGKRGQIPDEKGKIARLSGKRAWNPDGTTTKKRYPIGVSLVSI